jgi:hypothetical protein
VSIESAALLMDMAIAVLGILAGFILGWEVMRHHVGALFTAAIFSLTPEFVVSLMWQMPSRIAFTALIPVFIWVLLRTQKRAGLNYLVILVLTLFLMLAFHRLAIMMSIVTIAFVLAMILLVALRILRMRFPTAFLHPRVRRWYPYVALGAFFAFSAIVLFQSGVLASYSKGQLGSGTDVPTQLMNLGVSLARSSGLLLPLMFVGIVALGRRRPKDFVEPFLLVTVILLVPTLFLRVYTGYYTIPFTSLFVALGIVALLSRIRKPRRRAALGVGLIVFLLATTAVLVGFDLSLQNPLDDETYSAALYLRYHATGTTVFNEGLVGSRVGALSGRPFLPVGGATTAFQGPELLLFGFLDPDELFIAQIPLQDLTVESDSPFVLLGVNAEADWARILASPVDDVPRSLRGIYRIEFLLESWEFRNGYTAYGNVYPSLFVSSAYVDSYKVYEADGLTLWYVKT